VALLCAVVPASCRRTAHEPLLTYFNGEYGVSLQYPAGWRGEQAQQEGIWYRYFQAPPSGTKRQSELSVTLLAGTGDVEGLAQRYLKDNTLSASGDETRQGARGKWYAFKSADGSTRQSLLLVQEGGRVFGVHALGTTPQFEANRRLLEEMAHSFTLERAVSYPVEAEPKFGFSVGLPASWRETRSFSGGGSLLKQWTSPPLALESNQTTVHLSLTLSVEPLPASADLDAFYQRTRAKLGDGFKVLSHTPWQGGYVDVMHTETPVSVARIKRFYRVDGGNGYSLVFEARDDVFPRVTRWCDMIAGTLKTGAEVAPK
jgi:hypothetical protein